MRTSWFKNTHDHTYKYELTRTISFRVPMLDLANLEFCTQSNCLVAVSSNSKLSLMAGYRWDGCTGIGNIIETRQTLIASLLHDFLYQLSDQTAWVAPFTQRQADIEFRRLLPCWAKLLYYLGVRSAGWAFWGDKQDTLIIKNI